jgi:dienelactone hydrolase
MGTSVKAIVQLLLLECLFGLWQSEAQAAGYIPPAPSSAIRSVKYNWRDPARNRDVPVRIYYPIQGRAPFPVIIFSHGLGGSRDDYSYLGRYWAGCGYISVHVQHLGSDSAIWRNAPNIFAAGIAFKDAVADLRNAINRPLDVTFVIDQLARFNTTNALFLGKIDTNNIGVAGHSFGGFTSMAIAGEIFILPDGKENCFIDTRVKAAIEMSAPKSFNQDRLRYVYSRISIPVFHMTGTKDDSPIGETIAAERRLAFDNMTRSEEYLLNFKDGDHMVFSGRMGAIDPKDPEFQKIVCRSSVAFWDTFLKGNPAARMWLERGAFEKELAERGSFEKKMPRH